MGERMQSTTAFKAGQSTNEHKGDAPKVKVKENMSQVRHNGEPDPLVQALKGRDTYIPQGMHKFSNSKTSKPYAPMGEFGKPADRFKTKATGMGSHTSKKGDNALGQALSRGGQNALSKKSFRPKGGGKNV